jgi:hypothetical protein
MILGRLRRWKRLTSSIW